MRRLMTLILGTLLFTSVALVAAAQRVPIGTLEGTVLDGQGKPVGDASVTIQTSDGLHPHATRTDIDGHFQFTRWETGQYDVRAYANGSFSEWEKRIMIRSKKSTKITLRLPKKSDEKVVVSSK
ncbi:MAG: carboxypeptidase-like regulatory domain-containing protein [Candidatus Acidiferrales bacterium]